MNHNPGKNMPQENAYLSADRMAVTGKFSASVEPNDAVKNSDLDSSIDNSLLLLAPLERTLPGLPGDVAMKDWDVLLNSVKLRLGLTVDKYLVSISRTPMPDTAITLDRVRATVLECTAALDQLHMTLEHEFSRLWHLEREALNMQAALIQTRAELVGTQAGERRARHLALHDEMTSLPNRSYFHQRLDDALVQASASQQALALLYLDLDGFKAINDEHGHHVGDELLCIVALRLKRAIRIEDMVSRIGGDEFACMAAALPDREQLSHFARKLFDAVSAPVKIGKLRLIVRPSIGIAKYPVDGSTAEVLFQKADAAMYCAKRYQTGHAFFDQIAD